jgi:cysteine synthase A
MLYRITQIAQPGAADIYAKCEFRNPTASHKDRIFDGNYDRYRPAVAA